MCAFAMMDALIRQALRSGLFKELMDALTSPLAPSPTICLMYMLPSFFFFFCDPYANRGTQCDDLGSLQVMGPLIENLHDFGYTDANLIAMPVRAFISLSCGQLQQSILWLIHRFHILMNHLLPSYFRVSMTGACLPGILKKGTNTLRD